MSHWYCEHEKLVQDLERCERKFEEAKATKDERLMEFYQEQCFQLHEAWRRISDEPSTRSDHGGIQRD